MSLNESHSEFRAGKYLYDAFPINNCFKYAIWKVRVKGKVVPVLNEAPRHEGVMGKWMYSSTHSLTSAPDADEWSASRPGRFTPRERVLGTHRIGGG